MIISDQKLSLKKRVQIGCVAGLVGGFAIFLSIFVIDLSLGPSQGTFYKLVGLAVGLSGLKATLAGMVCHMLVASLIGAVFGIGSGLHKKLDVFSIKKGALAGIVTGLVVFGVFFVPISLFVIMPVIQSTLSSEARILTNPGLVMSSSAELHSVFGVVMGVFFAIAAQIESKNLRWDSKSGLLRAVIISIIIGTFLIGTYYVATLSYVQPEQQNKLDLALSQLQSGLSYEKFIALPADEKSFLLQSMPDTTRQMVLAEAQARPSFAAQSKDTMTELSGTTDLKMLKQTPVSGIKGYKAAGTASVFVSGTMTFLRFEDFGVTSGIDQHVYLTKDGTPDTGIDIGPLKASQGDQNYDISGIDHSSYNFVIIYSKPFDLYYAYAKLPKSET